MSYPPYQGQGGYPYPPQSHSPQPGYPPPQNHSPQPGYGQAAGQYGGPAPFHQQHGGFQGAYGGPQSYQGPPQQPGPYHQPPQHQANWGQPQNAGGYPPEQFQSGYNYASPPAHPSMGYDPRAVAHGDASRDADALRSAMKGFGTDEKALIAVLSKPDPLQMRLLGQTFAQRHHGRSLERDVEKETSGYFKEGLLALVRGPLMQDVHNMQKAIKGFGTKESVMNDVLLGRSNADLRAIKQVYHETYKHSLESDVKNDLSLKTERLFSMVLAASRAEESAPVVPHEIDRAVDELHKAMEGRVGTDQITVCSILSSRSDGQIRMIAQTFQSKYHVSLEDAITKEFSGHMKDALILIVRRACDRAMSDAVQLEDAMKGVGTKDDLLVNRVVRVHWTRDHMDQVKRAYAHRYKKDLIQRIRGETSGDEQRLLIACLS
ncbi:MAG: hypothetical protein Q9227_008192 [Pyrenula ochraceoflavens]